jgi:hypothetical protein
MASTASDDQPGSPGPAPEAPVLAGSRRSDDALDTGGLGMMAKRGHVTGTIRRVERE